MGRLGAIQLDGISSLTSGKPALVVMDLDSCPIVGVTLSGGEGNTELAEITSTIFGNQKVVVAFFNVPPNAGFLKEKIDQLMLEDTPVVHEEKTCNDCYGKIKQGKPPFSARELEILQMIAMEYTNEQIADKLCLAKRTVDNHRVNLMQRFNAKNTAGLIGYAFRKGLIV